MKDDQGEITTRDELVRTLALAAELEHLLLCQYLFAAYSIKRTTAEGLDAVELEKVRRWGSGVTLVARQEMEHLGLVMNLMNAIGATPFLRRPNFPQKRSEFGSADLNQLLTPLSPDTVARFQHFEQPHPPPGAGFCTLSPEEARALRKERYQALEVPRRLTAAQALEPAPMTYDSIQALYLALRRGFTTVSGQMDLFTGNPSQQIWGGPGSPYAGGMDDLNQYGLDLVPVRNLESAHRAIDLILEQGEGLFAPPDYPPHTHYCIFTKILGEMAESPGLVPARPVVANPLVSLHPDITAPEEVNIVTRPETRQVAIVSNATYQLMLEMLVFLYANQQKTPDQAFGLTNAIFFPLMTMFVRPLGEILTELPAFTDRPGNAGPGFELPGTVVMAPRLEDAWATFQYELDLLTAALGSLSILGMKSEYPTIVPRLEVMREDMARLTEDWRQNWTNIGRL